MLTHPKPTVRVLCKLTQIHSPLFWTKNERNREIYHFGRKMKFTILDEIWTKIKNLDEILDEIGDFGRTKNDTLDNILVSPTDYSTNTT